MNFKTFLEQSKGGDYFNDQKWRGWSYHSTEMGRYDRNGGSVHLKIGRGIRKSQTFWPRQNKAINSICIHILKFIFRSTVEKFIWHLIRLVAAKISYGTD